ncbi:hypothetical protein BU26DRAFT_408267, partial [Trematosphaeria pertusa]
MGRNILLHCLLSLLVLAHDVLAQSATTTTASSDTAAQTPNTGYNGGVDNPQDPSDAGAAGASKGAFSLSRGGLIAIIVVAVLVAVGGVGSAVLFWLAKKRQWDVRQSIRRASRRLTGRSDVSKRQNRRTGVRLNSPPPARNAKVPERDVEKGLGSNAQKAKTTTTITS